MKRIWIRLSCAVLVLLLLAATACEQVPPAEIESDSCESCESEQGETESESDIDSATGGESQTDPDKETSDTDEGTDTTEPDQSESSSLPDEVDPDAPVVTAGEVGYTYPELQEDLEALAHVYGEHFSYESIGQSVDGREIYACVVGNPEAPKKIMVTGGIHGREYLSSLVVMMQIEHYLSDYQEGSFDGMTYAQMFEQYAFYVLPMINPDGIMLALCGIESVQTPSVKETLEEIFADNTRDGLTSAEDINDYFAYNWKANARGVDLNRNFALSNWSEVMTGILSPCFRNYKGPRPASEPETQAVSAYVESLGEIEGMLAFHTAGQVVYWDCGMTGAVRQETSDLARAVCDHTGYRFIYDDHLDASLNDWMTLELGIPTVTVELANVIYPMPTSELDAAWEQARDLWVVTAQFFSQ